MRIQPREPVILAEDFSSLVRWYQDALGFTVARLDEDVFHYCNLENSSGIRVGIADAGEMGVEPGDRSRSTVVLQFQVPDVKEFFAHVTEAGGQVTSGPSYDSGGKFWFGSIADPEGNPIWIVDDRCP